MPSSGRYREDRIPNDIYERYIDRLHQEKAQFLSQMNIYLISQSMLILAYVNVLNNKSVVSYFNSVFGVIGLIMTIIFFSIFLNQFKQISNRIDYMKKREIDVQETEKNTYKKLSFSVPIIFFIIWVVFIIYSISLIL